MFRFTLSILILGSLMAQPAMAKTITGKQCKELVSSVTALLDSANAEQYWDIRAEYPNVLNMPLKDISQISSDNEAIKDLVTKATTLRNDCSKNCEGLKLNNGAKFQCGLIDSEEYSIMDMFYGMNHLDDDATATLVEEQAQDHPWAGIIDPFEESALNHLNCLFEEEGCEGLTGHQAEDTEEAVIDPTQGQATQ